ncbi:MAG: sigma-54-dependent Fis family transcriptional regulator [Fibrobacteres bacterium]|nr:sigma-54-dependent Fis family transcriptional regulator [Fibrobacterota bacterium]
MLKVLLLDRDTDFRLRVADAWDLPDSELRESTWDRNTFTLLEEMRADLVFLDAGALWQDGVDILSWIRSRRPSTQVVVLADEKNRSEGRSALGRGAIQVLVKPLEPTDLVDTARRAANSVATAKNSRDLETQVLEDMLGDTPEMRKILRIARKVAPTSSTVLITGESGTGKEFFANIVHRLGARPTGPFVAVNCGAIPETLVESELFGSKKGSFTGAVADRKGLFEEAEFGTLFLDEVGELPLSAQVKLLRFLQTHEVRPVGDTESRIVDVRVLAATNRDLQADVAAGRFREDLWFRLNVFHLHLPPLRERPGAIPGLCRFFVHRYNQVHGRNVAGFDRETEEAILTYSWPGNIRELENALEHAVILAEGEKIRTIDLPESVLHAPRAFLQLPPGQEVQQSAQSQLKSLAEVEKTHILRVLDAVDGNQTEAAQILGIGRSTLWRKLRDYGLEATEPS